MKANRFLKAISYVSEHYFSKPYSISPMVDRWFNQLAMIELENKRIVSLSGLEAMKFMDIILDGKVVPRKDVETVIKFHSRHSKAEELKQFEANKEVIEKLYKDIVERGQTSLNENKLQQLYGQKINKILYRPNHDLAHSARVAYMITKIHAFKKVSGKHSKEIDNDTELEKLQTMMLFSVVGRCDETGFSDTGDNVQGCETYARFKANSGREYLKYCCKHLTDLYQNDLDAMYRDAIIVELMGYENIQDRINRKENMPPEVFLDYVIEKEKQLGTQITRTEALDLINGDQKKYSLAQFFSFEKTREIADAKLEMMNDAHSIDLIRCYSLWPFTKGGSNSLNVINRYVYLSGYHNSYHADVKKLESFFKLLRCSFDTLALTGQSTTFGLISQEEFDAKKNEIIQATVAINKRFSYPISQETREQLQKEIEQIRQEKNYRNNLEGLNLINKYQEELVLREIVKHITTPNKLQTNSRKFDYLHAKENDSHKIDHYKNAVSLIQGLQTITSVKGVADPIESPVISAVKHDRPNNTVTVFFEDEIQAHLFKETYATLFGIQLNVAQNSPKNYSIVANREHYKHLHDDQLIEFKPVAIPKTLSREESLVDSEGSITALKMIKNSQALVRLVSTSALNGETFPDYDYLFKSLENPIQERYASPIKENPNFPAKREKYKDPRTNKVFDRKIVSAARPGVRFQEPITEPIKFKDKIADGWVIGKRGEPQNTIFTKKLSHSLLPYHGKMLPFEGYPEKKSNYFPIGVLSDVRQVDLKDERYIWAQNMSTATKFWIRDHSNLNNKFYKSLNAKMEHPNQPMRSPQDGILLLDQSKLKKNISKNELISHLQMRNKMFIDNLHYRDYRPSDSVLQDFKTLLQQEYEVYRTYYPEANNEIKEIYATIEENINLEYERKSSKYAISLNKLVERQKEKIEAYDHNEILLGNTKGATQALYAPCDELFARLNLAFHALEIKKKYQYDVPLLILSQDKEPYHYTESMIKKDLKAAYELLRQGQFPYDKKQFIVYERNSKKVLVPKKNLSGDNLYEMKNQTYQKELLVNLFKMGLPLTNIEQLEKGQIESEKLDEVKINKAIDVIVEQMDVIGGLARERKLMKSIFAYDNTEKKEAFFLRQIALGNLPLIQEIIKFNLLTVSPELLEKAIQIAGNNNHSAIEAFFEHPISPYFEIQLKKLIKSSELENPKQLIAEILNFLRQSSFNFNELQIWKQIAKKLLTNSSKTLINERMMYQLIKLLNNYPEYQEKYAQIMTENKNILLSDFIIESIATSANDSDLIRDDSKKKAELFRQLEQVEKDFKILEEPGVDINKMMEKAKTYITRREKAQQIQNILNKFKNTIDTIEKDLTLKKGKNEALALYETLQNLKNETFNNCTFATETNEKDLETTMKDFAIKTKEAIDKVTPILGKKLGWGDHLVDLVNKIAIVTKVLVTSKKFDFSSFKISYAEIKEAKVQEMEKDLNSVIRPLASV